MDKLELPEFRTSLCAALLLCTGTLLAVDPPEVPPSFDAVILTGWLHVEDPVMSDVLVEVAVNGTRQIAPVSETGRFTIVLPLDAEAVLRFEKPGHLPKEVTVDTHFAQVGEPGQKVRRIKFAVILELERHMGRLTYAGPVGSIGFDAGGGCVAVDHDRRMIPAQRQKVMVF